MFGAALYRIFIITFLIEGASTSSLGPSSISGTGRDSKIIEVNQSPLNLEGTLAVISDVKVTPSFLLFASQMRPIRIGSVTSQCQWVEEREASLHPEIKSPHRSPSHLHTLLSHPDTCEG